LEVVKMAKPSKDPKNGFMTPRRRKAIERLFSRLEPVRIDTSLRP
jgi:hypothetical protein